MHLEVNPSGGEPVAELTHGDITKIREACGLVKAVARIHDEKTANAAARELTRFVEQYCNGQPEASDAATTKS